MILAADEWIAWFICDLASIFLCKSFSNGGFLIPSILPVEAVDDVIDGLCYCWMSLPSTPVGFFPFQVIPNCIG